LPRVAIRNRAIFPIFFIKLFMWKLYIMMDD
jgi:hypothetical protein